MNEHDGEPPLPLTAEQLQAWSVPDVEPGFTGRMVMALRTSRRPPEFGSHPDVAMRPRPPARLPWAVAAVAVAAAVLLSLWIGLRGNAPSPDEPPPQVATTQPAVAFGAPTQTGVILVRATPSDAAVTIDSQSILGGNPVAAAGLPYGKHRIVVSRSGYLRRELEVDLAQPALEIPVELDVREVVLEFETDPPRATVSLLRDGKSTVIAEGGGRYRLQRDPGVVYEVEANAPGYATGRVPLALSDHSDELVRIRLIRVDEPDNAKRAKASASSEKRRSKRTATARADGERPPRRHAHKTSVLRIATNPGVAPATVLVDGKYVGKTPIGSVRVTPGRHVVKFKWPNGREIRMAVTVANEASKVVKAG